MTRWNPEWTEEELLLAYWVFKCRSPSRLSARDGNVGKLSDLLIQLPIHPPEKRLPSFRAPDGVRRRLSYLQAIENGEDVSGHEPYKEVVEAFRESPEEFDRKCQWIMQTYGVQWPEP